ncbi:MAG: S41 family peptidase [Monoglobales bacterium]
MKKLLSVVLCILLLTSYTFAAEENAPSMLAGISPKYANNVKAYIENYYKHGVDGEEIYKRALEKVLDENPDMLEAALKGMLEGLDHYSTYMPAEEYKSWMESLSGTFVGIGVTIEQRGDYIVVVSPISGSGADIAGVQAGDKIVSVNGESVVGKPIETVRSLIVGDIGTTVDVGILRGNELITFTITRAPVEQTTVSHSVTDEGLGYIAISSFAETTPRDVKAALNDFDEKNIKKLIIDVRNNPGGELNSLLDTLRLFMPKGDILYINYKNEASNIVYKNDKDNSGKYKIVILANENSASAAEAFAASMKDAGTATIVGRTTFGKGSMQVIQRVITGGAIKLTVALYQSAGGSFVDGVGVTPHYHISNVTRKLNDNPTLPQMQFSLVIDENSSPEAIKAVELRLKLLSISPGAVDGVFDADTVEAVKKFQSSKGLEPTGILDVMTQSELYNATRDIDTKIDRQYIKAVEILTD